MKLSLEFWTCQVVWWKDPFWWNVEVFTICILLALSGPPKKNRSGDVKVHYCNKHSLLICTSKHLICSSTQASFFGSLLTMFQVKESFATQVTNSNSWFRHEKLPQPIFFHIFMFVCVWSRFTCYIYIVIICRDPGIYIISLLTTYRSLIPNPWIHAVINDEYRQRNGCDFSCEDCKKNQVQATSWQLIEFYHPPFPAMIWFWLPND